MTPSRRLCAVLVTVHMLLLAPAGYAGYQYLAARSAQELSLEPRAQAAADQATAEWLRQIDLPAIRLVITHAEEYGEGNYLFVFDVYRWWATDRGFATVHAGSPGSGGTLSRGGSALSDPELQYIRARWTEQYGAAQVLERGTVGS